MTNQAFLQTYGPWALITGASTGIGETFAKHLARKGFNLVLVARRKEQLDQLASELSSQHSIECRTIPADMSQLNEVEHVIEKTNNLDIGLLIPNAGVEYHAPFDQQEWAQLDNLMQVNMTAPTRLAHHFAKIMKSKKSGGIIFVSSIAGFFASCHFAQYSASKGYIQLLSEAMYQELKPFNVDVLALAPGPTDTNMGNQVVSDMRGPRQPLLSRDAVVSAAISQLGRKPFVIPGFFYKSVIFLVTRLLPRRLSTFITKILYD
ncbi:MAG: SDR family NAD(P)-dependent oxidoreductase [Endozoicomonas sp.]